MHISKLEEIEKAIEAISEGYDYTIESFIGEDGEKMCHIVVENPDHQPDDGSYVNLVLQMRIRED
jgi:hypothetical protein